MYLTILPIKFKTIRLFIILAVSVFLLNSGKSTVVTFSNAQSDSITSSSDYIIDESQTEFDDVSFIIQGNLYIRSSTPITIINSILTIGGELSIESDGHRIEDCYINVNSQDAQYGWGIFFKSASNNILKGNTIEQSVLHGSEIMRMGSIINNVFYTGSDNNLIESNTFIGENKAIDSFASHENILRENTFQIPDDSSGEIEITSGNSWTIDGNKGHISLSVNGGSAGISVVNNEFDRGGFIECAALCNIQDNVFRNRPGNARALGLVGYQYGNAELGFFENNIVATAYDPGLNLGLAISGNWEEGYIEFNEIVTDDVAIYTTDITNFSIGRNRITGNVTGLPYAYLSSGGKPVFDGAIIQHDIEVRIVNDPVTSLVKLNDNNYSSSFISYSDMELGKNIIEIYLTDANGNIHEGVYEIYVEENNDSSAINVNYPSNLVLLASGIVIQIQRKRHKHSSLNHHIK